ncbi:centromere-associated protein E isoform X3 [Anabas testudineus]|uniref:centromere-associated protein E isoform X3 n=1 Tax=Anabas testudineus TaxID=64144 RepID=UPI000E4549CB|nr:centromere-associated protein E isoform X3 [Anabas testudineus]
MSFKDNPCRKFQANIFNKSKCQNCFKPRESHLLNEEDLTQAKPIYGGWLLLAPEGTNFDNPLHRSRKWQRRFFVLYEHGLLRYALDEMPSTLPQGTINMNQCSDVIDGESRTGQKNSLCILTPEKEHFIRAECKEIINGWQEALTVYPRTNKQNQKKKRKVDPPTHQGGVTPRHCFSTEDMNGHPEPGPAKVTVTSSSGGSIPCLPSSIASAERVPMSRATLWQEESRWSRATIPCSRSASCLSQLGQSQPDSSITTQDDGGTVTTGRKVRVESGYFSLEKTKSEPSPHSAQHSQPLQPPQHLPLSSSASSCSLGAPSSRYSSESEPQTSPYQPSQDPLPSPGALVSPSYSTISSSQSSLDSEPSGTTPPWEGHSGSGGSIGGGGRVGRSGREYAALSDVPRARRLNYREAFRSDKKRQELRARTRSPGREEVARLFGEERRRSQIISRFEGGQHVDRMDTSSSSEPSATTMLIQRQGRSERRYLANKHELSLDAGKDRSVPDVSSSTFANLRRAKSLDRRVTESSMTPDLLNFKKGWMTKLYEDGVWKKHWFVLTDQSLKYYKDSIAEEASELDGEIDLSTCYDVKEFPVQRNYGFQILCKEGACTLSAMTSGIRRNWIQAIMKNVRPTIAPDVTRKNISLKLSVLKPRSLLDENLKAQVMLEPCTTLANLEPCLSNEAPKSDVHIQPAGNNASAPPSEPRKSRVRERRREGRSKTFDWSEFKMQQSEKPVKERADTVDLSSSFSTTSSYCSPSTSPSSLASSPVSTSTLQTSSVSGVSPSSVAEEVEKENVRRTVPPHSTTSASHMPNTVTVTMASTLNSTPLVQPLTPESQEQGKMEVDHPAAMHSASEDRDNRTTDVHEEIEQRWHQVETIPLREEKQVPITTALGNSGNSDRLPSSELAALLDKELGHKQKELDRLQKENNLLKEQLEDALGREQNAREGYVLQSATPPPSSPHRVPWQHLHRLTQDLQGELESQKHKQDLAQQQIRTLKRSYTEAQDAVDHHEADIQALQAKLTSAMAEILASEQAVARMRNELKLEQERSREQEEEYGRGEATLRAQLKESEDRLREVEASLLERNQALRHLEHQQALQRDHMREIQRLQERLQEVTARLSATEEGQALKEERLRNEQHSMQESHERERQNLCKRLAEAESACKEMDNRLMEAEQQIEALLRGRQDSGGKECREEMLKLQEELAQKSDLVESLRESVRRLEEEKGHLTCRCQELLNQIAEADREVTKLRNRLETEEADYYKLEHSYERATQEFQKMSQFLKEKEEEIRQTKEMYERLVERKEEDLKEALIKMTALGNSLEETEQKLQAKEELLCQMSQSILDKVEPCSAEKDLQAKLVVAEDRIAELEQHLNALQLGYADLRTERPQISEQSKKSRVKTSPSLSSDIVSKTENSPDEKESQAKRPRIRFSSIQCQKYMSLEGMDSAHVSSAFVDTGQKVNQDINEDIHQNEGNLSSDATFSHTSDPEKFISIIHALESKLLATEDKLRNLTQNLEEQRSMQTEDMSKIDLKMTQKKPHPGKEVSCGSSASKHYAMALVSVENSREKVKAILSGSHDTTGSQLHSLSEIENDLFNASLYIQQGQKTLEQQTPAVHQNQTPDILDKEALHLFAKTLSFEAVVLNKMALLIQTSKPDLLQAFAEIWEDIENIKRSEKDCLAVVYADVLTRKLMLESEFWKELGKVETDIAKFKERSGSADVDVDATVIFNTFIKAELSFSIQNLKLSYEEKFKLLKKELIEAHGNLYKREMALKAIIEASKRPDLKNVIKEVKNNFGFSKQKLADIRPPELAPYMEQIEMEAARDLAEEIVDKHLAGEMPSCAADSIQSLQNAHDNLANELQRQADILHKYAQEIESGANHPGLAKMIHALSGHQTSHNFTSTSICMREALIQAQVAYVACRLRAMHEQDLVWCKQTGQNMDALVQQHAHNVSAIQEKYEASMQEERLSFTQTVDTLQKENQTLKSELSIHMSRLSQQQEKFSLLEQHYHKESEEIKQKHTKELSQAEQSRASTELALMETTADSQRKLEVLLVDMDTMEEQHESHVRKLEEQFEQRICELQHIHKEELEKLHSHYVESIQSVKEHKQDKVPEVSHLPTDEEAIVLMEEEEKEDAQNMSEVDSMVVLKDRIQELETQMNTMRDELENKHLEGDVASLREKYQRDFESLKATCERGFAAMEETHQKVIEDLHRQHQREISKLMEERERLLAEETAATIAAIEAMKNAHKEELEKTQRSQLSGLNSDIDELRLQYEEELQSIQRELEVLSEQYSQKCLENAHLSQALEAERQALRQCQRENQELNAHNQELNNRLTTEITRMRSCFSGETALSPLTQGKDVYELEVLLRIKESEIQYLKQEIHSLKDELQSALRDKKYATDKYKDIYTELSIVKAKADCDISKLREKLLIATEALGERTVDGTVTSGYDIMKSKSNPDFMKKEQSATSRQSRGVRSKSLKEGLTVQERMKLFEAKDSKKI